MVEAVVEAVQVQPELQLLRLIQQRCRPLAKVDQQYI
jgi:hypothetical protein